MPGPVSAEQAISSLLSTALAQGSQVTDYNPGSVFRTIHEAVGVEIEGLWSALLSEADSDIRQVLYSLLDVPLGLATAATAQVVFSVGTAPSSAIPIPAGTIVGVPNSTLQYVTQSAGSIPSGQTSSGTLIAVCQTLGTIGNVPANSITQIITPLSLLQAGVTVTNPQPVTNGQNQMTDIERAAQAQRYLAQLHRGSADALEAGALLAVVTDAYGNVTESVTKAQAVPSGTLGQANLYVYNGTPYSSTAGAGASSALIAAVQNEMTGYTDASGTLHYGYAVAGQQVIVSAVTESQVNVTVNITPVAGQTLAALVSPVTNAINSFFAALDIGQGLSLSLLTQAILQVPGVADASVTSPTSPIAGVNGTLLFAGTITVN
jgi:uncharacterized phage protein gp47/JayE